MYVTQAGARSGSAGERRQPPWPQSRRRPGWVSAGRAGLRPGSEAETFPAAEKEGFRSRTERALEGAAASARRVTTGRRSRRGPAESVLTVALNETLPSVRGGEARRGRDGTGRRKRARLNGPRAPCPDLPSPRRARLHRGAELPVRGRGKVLREALGGGHKHGVPGPASGLTARPLFGPDESQTRPKTFVWTCAHTVQSYSCVFPVGLRGATLPRLVPTSKPDRIARTKWRFPLFRSLSKSAALLG